MMGAMMLVLLCSSSSRWSSWIPLQQSQLARWQSAGNGQPSVSMHCLYQLWSILSLETGHGVVAGSHSLARLVWDLVTLTSQVVVSSMLLVVGVPWQGRSCLVLAWASTIVMVLRILFLDIIWSWHFSGVSFLRLAGLASIPEAR